MNKWRIITWSPLKSFYLVSYWAKQNELSDIILSVEYVMLWLGDMLWCGDMWPRQLNLWDRYYPFLAQKDAGILVNKLFILKVIQTVSLINRSYLREASKQQQTPSIWSCRRTKWNVSEKSALVHMYDHVLKLKTSALSRRNLHMGIRGK